MTCVDDIGRYEDEPSGQLEVWPYLPRQQKVSPKTRNPDFTAPRTAGVVPDFASTTGHSIPDPDDPKPDLPEKNLDPGLKTGFLCGCVQETLYW